MKLKNIVKNILKEDNDPPAEESSTIDYSQQKIESDNSIYANKIVVPESQERNFLGWLSKVNKKASRYGASPLIAKELERSFKDKWIETSSEPIKVKTITYEISATEFIINGWTFVATIEHLGKANVFHRSPYGYDIEIPDKYKHTSPQECEHCHQRRARVDTYIIYNVQNKEFKQVGKTCLKDYIGDDGLKRFLFAKYSFNALKSLEDSFNEYGGGGRDRGVIVGEILTIASMIIRHKGWVSSSQERNSSADPYNMKTSTATYVRTYLSNPRSDVWLEIRPTEEDSKIANAVREWFLSIEPNSEYVEKVQLLLDQDYVTDRNIPIVVSAVAVYLRHLENVEKKKAGPQISQDWVGKVGDKISDIKVKIISEKTIEGPYGVSILITMIDQHGHLLKWFASNPPDLQPGQEYEIKVATIKKHDEYKGTKSTTVTRVKFK